MPKPNTTAAIDSLKNELGRYMKKTEDQEGMIKRLNQDAEGLRQMLSIASAYVSYLTAAKALDDGRKVIFIPKKEISRRLGAVSVRARDAGDSYEVEIIEQLKGVNPTGDLSDLPHIEY